MTTTTTTTFRLAATALVLALAACTHSLRGGPEPTMDAPVDPLSSETSAATPVLETAARELFECADAQCRGILIERRLALIDQEYAKYVRALRQERSRAELGRGFGGLLLGLAGTLTDSAADKTHLAAAGTLLAGGAATVDSTLFYEQTVHALIGAMDANRATVRLAIRRAGRDLAVYPAADIHADLLAYERAGTLMGAVAYIQASAKDLQVAAETDLRAIHPLAPGVRDRKRCATDTLLEENDALTPAKLAAVATRLGLALTPAEQGSRSALIDRLRGYNRHGSGDESMALFTALEAEGLTAACP